MFVDTVGIESADFGSRVRRISELSRCRKIKGRIPLILRSKWKFAAFPKIWRVRKAAKLKNKKYSHSVVA